MTEVFLRLFSLSSVHTELPQVVQKLFIMPFPKTNIFQACDKDFIDFMFGNFLAAHANANFFCLQPIQRRPQINFKFKEG